MARRPLSAEAFLDDLDGGAPAVLDAEAFLDDLDEPAAPSRAPAPARVEGEEDSWLDLGRKALGSVGPRLRRAAGGMLQGIIENPPSPAATAGMFLQPGGSGALMDPALAEAQQVHRERAAQSPLAAEGRRIFEEATADLAANAPNVDPESLKGYAYDIAAGILNMAPAVAASIATRSPVPGMAIIGGQVAGEQYGESRAEGRTPEQAGGDAAFFAVAEALPEALPLAVLIKPGGRFLARTLKAAGAEGIQEVFTEALQTAYQAGVIGEDMTWGEAFDRMKRAGIVGAGMGGGLAVTTHPFTRERTPKPAGEREKARIEPSLLTPADRASPIPDDLIAEGKAILGDAKASQGAEDILARNSLPPLGARVAVEFPDGRRIEGVMQDAFSRAEAELGVSDEGVKIGLDDGTSFEEFMGTLRQSGARVSPVQPAAEEETPAAEEPSYTTPQPQETRAEAFLDGDAAPAAPLEFDSPEPKPTDGQKEAGNYRKGHVRVHGLEVSIENEAGSERSGTDADGKPWSVKMPADYGYIRRTEGADGDHVDVYLGPKPDSQRVLVVDQVDAETRAFDEHKVLIGWDSDAEALAAYDAAFSDDKGPQRRGAVTALTVPQFKAWLRDGDTTAPLAYREGEAETEAAPEQPEEEGEGYTPSDSFEQFRAALPKDAEGYPDMAGKGAEILRRVAARPATWADLNEKQRERAVAMAKGGAEPAAAKPPAPEPQPEPEPEPEPKRPAGKLYKGIPVNKPAAELTDEEIEVISKPDSTPPEGRNAELAKYESDPRFYEWARDAKGNRIGIGGQAAVQTSWRLIRNYLRDGTLSERGQRYENARKRLLELMRDRGVMADTQAPNAGIRAAGMVLHAAETGRFNEALHPMNKSSRALFEEITGAKLPKGLKATQALFMRKPFLTEDGKRVGEQAAPEPKAEQPSGPRVFVNRVGADGKTAAEREAEKAKKAKAEKRPAREPSRWEEIGKNAIGQTLYQDQRGVRSYIENGVRITMPVQVAPNGEIGVDYSRDPDRWQVATEGKPKAEKPAEQPEEGRDWWHSLTPEGRRSAVIRAGWANHDGIITSAGRDLALTDWRHISDDKRAELLAARDSTPTPQETATPEPQQPESASVAPGYGKSNKVFTESAAEKARARLRAKLKSQLSSGIDPEILVDGLTLAGYHIEAGARSFADYAAKMIGDLGEEVRPFLRSFYEAVRNYPGFDASGMTPAAEIDAEPAQPQIQEEAQPEEAADGGDNQNERPAEDDRRGDEGERPDDVPATAPERPARRRGGRARGARQADARRADQPDADAAAAEPGGRPDRAGGEDRPGDARGVGSGARAGRRVRRGAGDKPAGRDGVGDYSAPAGALRRKGSWRETAARNLDIIELVRKLDAEGRQASPEEQALLAQYVGWGASELANGMFGQAVLTDRLTGARRLDHRYARREWQSLVERAQKLFTPEDLETALRSTQFAHYTSEGVIRQMWAAAERLGFKGGRILEPGMGTGLFPVAGPAEVMKASRYTGVEMDRFTASIARHLLPQETVLNADFTEQKFPDGYYDLAIGNPPFSQTLILNDPAYRKQRFMLHDYFFAKTIDKVRPGGLLMFVTSKGTMDKQSDRARTYLAERADLLGAIRLPQTAFLENAGTEVVTDVLFLRKRLPGEQPGGQAWKGLATVQAAEGGEVLVNEYFAKRPEMVLGRHSTRGTMYAHGGPQYTVLPPEGDIEAAFAKAVERLPKGVFTPPPGQAAAAETAAVVERDFNPKAKKEGSVYVADSGALMLLENGSGVPLLSREKLSDGDAAWMRDYVGLRGAIKQAQYDQLNDGPWEKSLAALNKAYDAFAKKHGPISDFTTFTRTTEDEDGNPVTTEYRRYKRQRLWEMDIEGSLVSALERITEAGEIVKGAFLGGRTLKKPTRPEINTTQDALMVSLDERGRLDLAHVAELAGKGYEEAIEDLGDLIYQTPAGEWQMGDEYLSGDVVGKLEEAQTAAATDARLERNVKALIAVQPRPLAPAEITVGLGSAWVPSDVVQAFAESLGVSTRIGYEPATGQWSVAGSNQRSQRGLSSEWGTPDRSPVEILEGVLNSRSFKVQRTEKTDSGTKTYTDDKATAQVNEIAKKMAAKFRSWVWTDAARAETLTALYNRRFNNLAPRRFDGSHLTLPGLSLKYALHPHQKRAIWRIIQTGDTYLGHAVGAGKTLEMIVSGMEQRRLGLIRKPMYVVPNHMLDQFAREFLDAYPAANVMVAGEKNFHTENRRRFVAQAALNDPDAIIITHSAFGLLNVDQATREPIIEQMIADLEALIEELKGQENRIARKKVEQQRDAIKQRFAAKASDERKDKAVTFEEMDVDFLYIDEAHMFRKLDFATNRGNVKGIDPKGSVRALDLYIKTRYLARQRPGRSHVLASGTPVTNTMAELHTVMRFMDEPALERDGLRSFDAWAAQFGEIVPSFEQNAAGVYEVVERFARFVNVPELMKRVRNFMDVLTSSQLGDLVPRPAVLEGGPISEVAPASEEVRRYMTDELLPRIKISREWKPSPGQPGNPDPLINIITDGRLSAIDLRFVEKGARNDPQSKLNRMIDKIIAKHKAFAGIEFTDPVSGKRELAKGATQIVFSSVGFGEQVGRNRGFDLRGHMMARFKAAGIPASQVAWMSDYNTHAKKEAMFKEMRSGQKRILIGSPQNMGTGLNVQKRLKALHFLSPPWFPADVEQPHGRILRQGNLNPEIELYWYATKGTYDSTAWSMVARKARFIEQAFTGDDSVRKIEDVSEASQYEMASALAAGDERAIQLAGLAADIERLSRLQEAHHSEQRNLKGRRHDLESGIQFYAESIEKLEEATKAVGGYRPFSVEIGGQTIDKHGEAGEALLKRAAGALAKWRPSHDRDSEVVELGKLDGKHRITALLQARYAGGKESAATLRLSVPPLDPIELTRGNGIDEIKSIDAVGFSRRIQNAASDLQNRLYRSQSQKAEAETELAAVVKRIGAPFEFEGELAEKVAEAARLKADMASDSQAEVGFLPEALQIETWEGEGGAVLVSPFAEVETEETDAPAGAKLALTQRFRDDVDGLSFDLAERLVKLGLDGKLIAVKLRPKINVVRDGKRRGEADAIYFRRVIELSLRAPDKKWSFDHEAIHALRDLGLFKDAEWTTLENAALADKARMAVVRKAYPDLSDPELLEEAIADMFADYAAGKRQPKGFIRAAFERVIAFLETLGLTLRRRGYRSVNDVFAMEVFERVESGEIGRREIDATGPMGISPKFAMTFDAGRGAGEALERPAPALHPTAAAGAGSPPSGPPPVVYDSPESERRWQEARKGVAGQDSLLARTREWLDHVAHGFTRHFIHLPNEARFSDVREQLRKLEAAPQASKERVIRILRSLTDGMTAADLDLFTRKVVLDDLAWEAEQDHDLPFGFSPADVRRELAKVDAALSAGLRERVRRRKLIVQQVAGELVRAGVLHREQVRNPAYYRHQVLDYAREQVAYARGPGKKVKTPHWARRMGSRLDINANLLEAEFDWLHKAFTDTATAETIEHIKASGHNVRGDVIEAARAHNAKLVGEVLAKAREVAEDESASEEARLNATVALDMWKGFRQRIAMGLSKVRAGLDEIDDLPAQFQAAAERLRDPDADEASIFPLLAWMLDTEQPGAGGAAQAFKAINQRKAWVKAKLGKQYADTLDVGELVRRGFAPEGYEAWQPDEGNLLFTAKTLPEHVIDRFVDRVIEDMPLPAEFAGQVKEAFRAQAREVLAVGGKKFEMVLPKEIAETLRSFRDEEAGGIFDHMLATPMAWWKRWVLISPRRVLKYNLNNLSGDLDAVIAGDPKALRQMGRAIKELHAVMIKGKAPSARYKEAVDRGVFDSGLSVQEIPDINTLAEFERLINPPTVKEPGRFALSGLMKVWRGLQRWTQFRENWLRYAAYLDYVERLEGGESMASIGYGAARKEMVDAVADKKDRAALLARELVGDYGAISHFGKGIRRKVVPFWSWLEINTKRYWRLGANAWGQGVGQGLKTSGLVGATLGLRTTAWLGLRMAMLYGLVQLWNHLLFGDEEDELDADERARLHINLGRGPDGDIRLLRFQGAFSDFLGWLGFEDLIGVFSEIEKGRAGASDVLETVAKAPVNRVVGGVTPVIKLPVEIASGRQFWPDVFDPYPVRDGWRHLFRAFAMENEFDLIFDRPSRGYLRSAQQSLVTTRDVGENAYNRMKGMAADWLEREKGREGFAGVTTPRSDALYKWRLAKRYGDEAAERKALEELRELGVDNTALRQSIKRAHPLGAVALKDRAAFLASLDAMERKTLSAAVKWYEATFLD